MIIPKHIEHWDDERFQGNSLIVTLEKGWCFGSEDSEEHVRGFDSVIEARRETAKKRLFICNCNECKS